MNPRNPHPGALIVIEGIDGAGSTTQSEMLVAWLLRAGVPATFTSEPSKGPVGATLRQHLARTAELGGPQAEALAFAADRMDHVASEIVPALERGTTVVSDRYYLSSLAYQALSCDLAWLREINRFAIRPDLTVFLSVPVDVGVARFSGRATRERFEEDRDELARIAGLYDAAIAALGDDGEAVQVIDGTRSPAEIHAEIVALAAAVLGPRYPGISLALDADGQSTVGPTVPIV
ncbi:MAG: dTMP kinase [Candidatus Limnocylindrales bacterium]